MRYCKTVEMLLSWGSSGGDVAFQVVNPVQRLSKYRIKVHKDYILSAVELPAHRSVVSCGMDRTVCIWPLELAKTREVSMSNGGLKTTFNMGPTDKEVARKVTYLKG